MAAIGSFGSWKAEESSENREALATNVTQIDEGKDANDDDTAAPLALPPTATRAVEENATSGKPLLLPPENDRAPTQTPVKTLLTAEAATAEAAKHLESSCREIAFSEEDYNCAVAKPAGDLDPAAPIGKMFSLASPSDFALFFLGALGAVANGCSQPAMVYVWGRMIDSAGGGPPMSEQLRMMCLVGVATLVACTMQQGCLRLFSQAQAIKVQKIYYEATINQDVSWFDLQTTAGLASEISADCDKIANAFADKFAGGIQGASCFLVSMVLGFVLGWKLALVILAAVPLMAVAMVLMGSAMEEVATESQSWYSKAASTVEECLFALRTVVAFGGEFREIESYTHAVKQARYGASKNAYKTAFGMGFVEFVWACANAAALYFGMTLVYNGEHNTSTGRTWTGGDIIIVFFTILIGGFSIGQVEPAVKVLTEGRIAYARFLKIQNAATTIQCRGVDDRKQLQLFESFEFRGVHFSYPARPTIPVLKGLNLQIEKGQKVAMVGESGSGKSTVMALLERFYDPSQGSVLVNGEDFICFAPSSLRALIGYVGQEPVLFATSIRSNIMQGWPTATESDLTQVVNMAQLNFVDNLPDKLDTFVGSGGSQFSGGQKQRIAIARALLRKPKVLFLDEATSALDSASERMIQETIEKIGKEGVGGEILTTVAIAHRLSTIRHCDVIFALKAGVVVEKGNHSTLMEAKGLYYGLAATQEQSEEVEETAAQAGTHSENAIERKSTEGNAGNKDDANTARRNSGGMVSRVLEDQKAEEERAKQVAQSYSLPVQRLLSYNKPEWPWFVPGCLGALVHGANNPAQAFLIVGILDALYADKEEMKDKVTEIAIQFAILGAIIFVATASHICAFAQLAEGMTQRLRVEILTTVFRQEIGFHDDPEHTPGLIGTALQLWAYRVRNLCASIEANCAVMASLVLGIVLAFYGCWQMALAMMGAIPVLGIATSIQMAFMLGGTASSDQMKIAQQVVSDSVQNVRTVHACGMEGSLTKYHNKLIKEASTGFVLKCMGSGMAFGVAMAAPMFVMAFGFWYADNLIKNGNADFKGTMLAFMGILYAAMGAGQAAAMVGDAAKAKLACHDMFQLIDREPQIDGLTPTGEKPDWADQPSAKAQAGQIEFQNVRFFYPFRPDVQVLKGVNFTIQSGQAVGLVGPSGGGKSTIMSLIQRFYDPAEGSVCIGASKTPLSRVDIRWWRKQIGFVGQEPILFNTTVRANVMYGVDTAAGENVSNEYLAECKRMSHLDFIDSSTNQGWDTEVGARGGRLSGGQKQRVAICRALLRNPPVLLLDEATSALDTESERVVQQALELAREGRTSFAIAHRLSTIRDCDVILVTAEGAIVEAGTHVELMALNGIYSKLQAKTH